MNTVMERIIKEERAEVTIKAICNMIKYGVPKEKILADYSVDDYNAALAEMEKRIYFISSPFIIYFTVFIRERNNAGSKIIPLLLPQTIPGGKLTGYGRKNILRTTNRTYGL